MALSPPPPPPAINISSSPPTTQSKPPSSSLHRLPTVSASQALQDLQRTGPEALSTGVRALDALFNGSTGTANHGGLERGKVTELWGPKGAGKTAISLQAAATAMTAGHNVVWLDATTPLNGTRLATTITAIQPSPELHSKTLQRFHHLSLPTLSHLLSLLQNPPPTFPPANTTLIVIDNLHTLLDLDYPRLFPSTASTPSSHTRWASSRRYAVLGALGAALSKLAVLASAAVVVTTGCATRSRGATTGLGPALVPGVGGGDEWEAAVAARAVVFRDLGARRFVGLVKSRGRSVAGRPGDEVGEVGRLCEFEIGHSGVVREVRGKESGEEARAGVDGSMGPPALLQRVELLSSPAKARKRVHDEIADSEEEDVDEYGWDEDAEDAITAGGSTLGPVLSGADPAETGPTSL